MANDPNESNRGKPNVLDDSGFSDVERIGRRAGRHTAEDIAQRIRLSEGQRRIRTYEEGLAAGPSQEIEDVLNRALSQERRMVNSLGPRISLRAETQRQRFADLTQSAVERAFSESSVNGQSAAFGRSSTGSRLSMGMIGQSYESLEAKRQGAMNQIGALGASASRLAEDLYDERGQQDPMKLAQLQQLYTQKNRLINRVGSIDAAQRQQRSLGLDPESRSEALFGTGQRAERIMFQQGVTNELRSGTGDLGGKSLEQLKQREAQLAAQLIEELGKLKESAGKSAEEIDKMREAAQSTADNLSKTGEAINQVAAGGGGNRYSNTANMLNFASGAFGAVGAGIQAIAVNQRLGQTANIAGYAGIENQKYQTYKSAAGGDVLSQLMLGQYGGAESFGRELRAGAQFATGAAGAGGLAQAGAGVVRVASAASPLQGAIATSAAAGAALQGAGDILQGTVNTVTAGADLYRDVSGSAAAIAGVNAQTEARRQLLSIPAAQLQGFRDYSVGLGAAAQGMGGRGAAFLQRAITNSNLAQMVNARMSPEQFAEMSAMGIQNVGSTFNEGQIFGARGLERSGFGSVGENMQRMATLATAGSNNPQSGLGSVLEAAFTKSLDGSKVLNMMVENTGSMVQMSAGRAMGIDTTGASAAILAAGVNSADPNQEFAMQRAASAAERMKLIGTDTGVNFAAMSATARISKMTGLSGTEAIIAQQLDDQTLRAMKNMAPNEIKTKMFDRGIDVKSGQETQLVNQLIKARLITNLQVGGSGVAAGIDASAIAEKLSAGKPLNKAEQFALNQGGALGGFAGGGEVQRAATAIISEEPNQLVKGKVGAGLRGEGGSEQQKMLDDMRTQGFKQLSQAALEATGKFESAAAALKMLGELSKNVEKIGDRGGEGKFSTAAADAAGTFGASVTTFERSVGNFEKAIDNIMSRSGISSGETNKFLQDLRDKTSKLGTFGG